MFFFFKLERLTITVLELYKFDVIFALKMQLDISEGYVSMFQSLYFSTFIKVKKLNQYFFTSYLHF